MPFAAVATENMTHEKEMRLFKYTGFFPEKADFLLRNDERRLVSPENGKANSDQHVGAEGRTISKHEPLLCCICGQSWVWFRVVSLPFHRIWVQDVMEPAGVGEEDKEEEREKNEEKHHILLC